MPNDAQMPELLQRARYMINNPSAWDSFDQGASDIIKALCSDLCASGQVRALVDQAASIFTHCSVTDGVCCCGDTMEGHSHPMSAGHGPVDHGSYMADKWLDAYAAMTPAPQPEGQAMDGWVDDKTFIEPLTPIYTGVKDKDGNKLYLGDSVRYLNEGPHTKREYWNPEYEIVWDAPEFTLKHVGGGKDGGSHSFILKHGGGNGCLELVSRGNHTATPTAQEAVPVDLSHGWLIHKAGRGWYRPNAKGYTGCIAEAGRYSHEDALAYSHPNGWDGPRDNITIKHESEVAHPPQPSETVAEAGDDLVRAMRLFWEADEAADECRAAGKDSEAARYDKMATGRWQSIPEKIDALDAALRALKGEAE